jgi:hypothetical protein
MDSKQAKPAIKELNCMIDYWDKAFSFFLFQFLHLRLLGIGMEEGKRTSKKFPWRAAAFKLMQVSRCLPETFFLNHSVQATFEEPSWEFQVQTSCKGGICHTSSGTWHIDVLGKLPTQSSLRSPLLDHQSRLPKNQREMYQGKTLQSHLSCK